MTLVELIELAAEKRGSLKELAADMGKHQNRLTEWKKGTHKPDADEIAFLAKTAELPIVETIAQIQNELGNRYAEIWRETLGKLTAAGVAATVATMMIVTPKTADASPSQVSAATVSLYIMSTHKDEEQTFDQ
ncbi:MAG: helix-turn-helix domain-containing protein [Aquabacterium sp.]|uniref:helix-turn-helix domain-containing protein n=1 Tax=Aquabacterium sp. TaxID=1872578 RepID=UPI003BD2D5BE